MEARSKATRRGVGSGQDAHGAQQLRQFGAQIFITGTANANQAGMEDLYGSVTTQDTVMHFRTRPLEPQAWIAAPDKAVWRPGTQGEFYFHMANVSEATVSLYRVPVEKVLYFEQNNGNYDDTIYRYNPPSGDLVWQKTDDAGGVTDKDNLYSWTDPGDGDLTNEDGNVFTSFLSGLNGGLGFAGAHGWRLPSIAEFATIFSVEPWPCTDLVHGPAAMRDGSAGGVTASRAPRARRCTGSADSRPFWRRSWPGG